MGAGECHHLEDRFLSATMWSTLLLSLVKSGLGWRELVILSLRTPWALKNELRSKAVQGHSKPFTCR